MSASLIPFYSAVTIENLAPSWTRCSCFAALLLSTACIFFGHSRRIVRSIPLFLQSLSTNRDYLFAYTAYRPLPKRMRNWCRMRWHSVETIPPVDEFAVYRHTVDRRWICDRSKEARPMHSGAHEAYDRYVEFQRALLERTTSLCKTACGRRHYSTVLAPVPFEVFEHRLKRMTADEFAHNMAVWRGGIDMWYADEIARIQSEGPVPLQISLRIDLPVRIRGIHHLRESRGIGEEWRCMYRKSSSRFSLAITADATNRVRRNLARDRNHDFNCTASGSWSNFQRSIESMNDVEISIPISRDAIRKSLASSMARIFISTANWRSSARTGVQDSVNDSVPLVRIRKRNADSCICRLTLSTTSISIILRSNDRRTLTSSTGRPILPCAGVER